MGDHYRHDEMFVGQRRIGKRILELCNELRLLHQQLLLSLSNWRNHCEKMYGSKPNVSFVKVFGCKAFSFIEKQFQGKLDHRAQGISQGVSNNSKTFIIGIPVEQGSYQITKNSKCKIPQGCDVL